MRRDHNSPRRDHNHHRRRDESADDREYDYERNNDRDKDRERRHRRGHRATDSNGELLPKAPRPARHDDSERETPTSTPRRKRHSTPGGTSGDGSRSRESGSAPLSLEALARLDKVNQKKAGWRGYDYDEEYVREVRKKEERLEKERVRVERRERKGRSEDDERRRERDTQKEKARLDGERRRERETQKEKARLEDERRRERETQKEKARLEEQRKRAYESDIAAEEEARRERRERRTQERERRRGYTDDEREKKRGYTDDEREKRRGYTDDDREDRRKGYTDDEREEKRRRHEEKYTPSERAERRERRREEKRIKAEQKKRRVVSGPLLEEGGNDQDYEYHYMMEKRGGAGTVKTEYSEDELARRKKVKRILIIVLSILLILAIVIPVAVMVSKKNKGSGKDGGGSTSNSGKPSNSNLDKVDKTSIPATAKGGLLDPFVWYDTTDFNLTYTEENVGGLSLMGLNSTWDDDVQANPNVPNLKDSFQYGKMPIRGVNVGGWLNLEPFITPSFFSRFGSRDGVIDEYTYCQKMGPSKCKDSLERHYSTFVTRQTFIDIRNAGFDHVRIPFGYWAIATYDGDPYVSRISWRYLLRAIEYARQNGLRVNLDLHGAPGSQNGWNHSGRQGVVAWLNGTDGDLNAQRTLDIHGQLSTFFSQPRYKKVVTMYGLVNEPRMVDLDTTKVLTWTQQAIDLVRKNNITAILVFGDGFMGLDKWQGKLQTDDRLLLDVHQYVIFNINQLTLEHTEKLNFACKAWTQQTERSSDRKTGFGPTMCGEWSQADTDCATYLNNVGIGTRWEGTLNTGNASTSVLDPMCPTGNSPTCTCEGANADAGSYSEPYKKWLYQFAVAQMESFEKGWGWFYWNWDTEKAVQWSWKKGMAAGILPAKVWERGWSCEDGLEDFGKLGLSEAY